MNNKTEAGIPWMDDDLTTTLTTETINEIIAEDTQTLVTLVGIIIAAACIIVVLFFIAVFIDCRHQKIVNGRIKKSKNVLKTVIPKLIKAEDEAAFADKMQECAPTEVISKVV